MTPNLIPVRRNSVAADPNPEWFAQRLQGYVLVYLATTRFMDVLRLHWPPELCREGGWRGFYLKSPFPRVSVADFFRLLDRETGCLTGLHGGSVAINTFEDELPRLLALPEDELLDLVIMAALGGDGSSVGEGGLS